MFKAFQNMIRLDRRFSLVVRMAERSKALRSGRSLPLEAWVRIPLLTIHLFFCNILKAWRQTPLKQSFCPYIFFSRLFCLMLWFGTFKLLISFGVKIIIQKRCQFTMLKESFEIYIFWFHWLAWNNDNHDFVWAGKCNACWFDLSLERWTWQNGQEIHIENWWDAIRIQHVMIIISTFSKVKMSWRSYHE